ncbi:MAG TPA: GNAT family N-acetyltransferase [Casimicrobiaceae bacterium]|nr:GNAT family N-acetyltransferase [Casimicrobiaceae bacterium]
MPSTVRDDVPLPSIAARDWDALALGQPFLRHAFLRPLHESGCASPAAGWTPRFLTAWRSGALVGAMPLYAKAHSYGEYVFDWSWADAYRRHGRRYYPKLVAAVPFTPVSGPRILGADEGVRRALVEAALARVADGTHSSLHLLFTPEGESRVLVATGMIARHGVQFHWTNRGWRDFDDFLAAFSHDKRKKVRQDRRRLAERGVDFERRIGRATTASDWAFFFRCYEATYAAHGSTPYLTLSCFERLAEALGDQAVMVLGRRDGRPLCAALDVTDGETLWGRHWGTIEEVPGLHFEACYYQAIEHCLAHGMRRFEGGAQGIHKLARGLEPVLTHSWHAIGDPEFAAAIEAYCARERAEVARTVDELRASRPYRRVAGEA